MVMAQVPRDATIKIYQYTAAVIIIAVVVGLILFDPDEDEPTRYEPNPVIQMMDDWTFLNFTEDNVTDDALVLCGRFRLYHDYGLILTANRENNNIHIKNISEYTDDGCNATSISIYVDISGPERLGGFAIPSQNRCEWHYPFMITLSGTYTVEARLLYVNGDRDFNHSQCHFQEGVIPFNEHSTEGINITTGSGTYSDEHHIIARVQPGKRFIDAKLSCCEWCSRRHDCGYWISDGGVSFYGETNSCILMSKNTKIVGLHDADEHTDVDAFPMTLVNTTKKWVFGVSRTEICHKYLGAASWATIHFRPDLMTECSDDMNLIHSTEYVVNLRATESQQHKAFSQSTELCTFRKDLDLSGRWRNMTHFAKREIGDDGNIANMSNMTHPVQFMPYHCRLNTKQTVPEMLDILRNEHNVHSIYLIGDSIINAIKEGASATLPAGNDQVKFIIINHYSQEGRISAAEWPRVNVVVDDFVAIHKMWQYTFAEIQSYFLEKATRYDNEFSRYFGNNKSKLLAILLEMPSITSEREPHCTGMRVSRINSMARSVFVEQYGWHLFPMENITRAIAYPGRGAGDGMHTQQPWTRDIFRVMIELILNTLKSN